LPNQIDEFAGEDGCRSRLRLTCLDDAELVATQPSHDIAAVGRAMVRRGWMTGHVKNPPGLHLMLNLTHEPVVGEYLADLAASVQEAGHGAGTEAAALKAVY